MVALSCSRAFIPGRPRRTKRLEHALEAREDALEQELFLVGHVVVNRRLGDVERRRDFVDGGVVIAALAEGARRGSDDRLALHVARALPRAAHRPRRGVHRRGGDRCLRKIIAFRFHASLASTGGSSYFGVDSTVK